ncbi:MAG: hypothetical protein ACRDYZ_16890, partial [Acidimicrobiales bacterium]
AAFAVDVGAVVWAGIAAVVVAWFTVTGLSGRLPHAGDVLGWLVGSWLARLVAVAAWVAVGWHLFNQRP